MIVSIVIGHGANMEIGVKNQLPWRLSGDLKNFKKVTMGKPIAMGRKTFESIGRPLPGRENIVLTRDRSWSAEGVTVLYSLDELFERAESESYEELAIIGGAKILEQVMREDRVDVMYLTEVQGEFPDADVSMPSYDPESWAEVESFSRPKDQKNEYPWTFRVLRRKR